MKRSNMLLLLGSAAMLSLAGCKPAADDNVDATHDGFIGKNNKDDYLIFGDRTDVKGATGYVAEYDTLVYFGFDAGGKFISTVRYFKASGNDYPSIKQKMLNCISILDRNVTSSCSDQLAIANLDGFTFRAPTNVVFATNKPAIKFDAVPLVFGRSLLSEHPGYNDGPGVPAGDRKKAKPNKSFYNSSVYDENGRQLVYVSNYYTKKSGNNDNGNGVGDTPIKKGEIFWYSLNIFVNIEQVGGKPVKIIIDPDTGNNEGEPE